MLDEFQSEKAWARMIISYGTPGGTSRNSKPPLSGVVTRRGLLLSKAFSSTLALGTGSPLTSIAVPTMIPGFSSGFAFSPSRHVGTIVAIAIAKRIRVRLSMYLVLLLSE